MLEIKTIMHKFNEVEKFDAEVNEAIADGWDLVRRDVIPGWEGQTTIAYRKLYAELERIVDDPEEEEDDDHSTDHAQWVLTRNPRDPYRCSACGYNTNAPWPTCPNCDRIME